MQVINFYKKDLLVEFVKGEDIVTTIEAIFEWNSYEIRKITVNGKTWLELKILGETTLFYEDGTWKDINDEPASVTIL